MGDVEVVLKIPEEVKNRLCFGVTYAEDIKLVCKALDNGTLLPKGHERLIEANKLLQAMKNRDADNGGEPLNAIDRGYHFAVEHLQIEIDHAPSVIEADKE